MIDFWELSGRLLLMDPVKRKQEIYTDRLPILNGCILPGFCDQKAALPFDVPGFYDNMRVYFLHTYSGQDAILSPVISMFALGEIGVMFFNQRFRDLFEAVSAYLKTQSVVAGRTDTGSSQFFYMVLMLLVIDRKTRGKVVQGDFLGLTPAAVPDQTALKTLAADPQFITLADKMCLGDTNDPAGWTEGSFSTLRDQTYGPRGGPVIPFRHVRFIAGLP